MALNIAITLSYHAIVVLDGPKYEYSGTTTSNTEAQYNAIIWNDARPKPPWSTIVSISETAWVWFNSIKTYNAQESAYKIDTIDGRVDTIEDAIEGGLPPSPHTHEIVAADISDFTEAVQDAIGFMLSVELVYNDTANTIGLRARSPNNGVSRTLNSNYTPSTTQDVLASYTINVVWSLNALLSGSAAAFLEYSTDGGSNWIIVNQAGKTLSVLSTSGADDLNLVGFIPANMLTRIRTTSTNMTMSYTRGQEVSI